MTVHVRSAARPKGRAPIWDCRVTDGDAVVFESSYVSLRFRSREAAEVFGEIVDALRRRGDYPGTTNRPLPCEDGLNWLDRGGGDAIADFRGLILHVEHLNGPRRGGLWYCSVAGPHGEHFLSTVTDLWPRSEAATRWLCEVVARAISNGLDLAALSRP